MFVCLIVCFGCTKTDFVNSEEFGKEQTKSSDKVYDDAKASAIVASYASHDSVWHMNLTLKQALSLQITEDQYAETVNQMEAMNVLIRKNYSEGQNVVFTESANASPFAVMDDRILSIMSITPSNTTGHAVFSSRSSSVRLSVSCYPVFCGIDFGGGSSFYGRSGDTGSITGGTQDSSSSKFDWNITAVSTFTIKDGGYITVTFIE